MSRSETEPPSNDRPAPHAAPAAAIQDHYATHPEHGLSPERVEGLRGRHGPNELAEAPPAPAWKKFLAQFKELVVLILIAAAIISGFVGEWVDAIAILTIVVLNGVLGFLQEERAERALAKLRDLSAPMAKVVRGGKLQSIPARELVPGDKIELEAGDNIPADARLIRAYDLRVQEASLTGESVPVEKDHRAVLDAETPLGDRRNMVYMSTMAASGRAGAVVVATGMQTELGRIAGLLSRAEPEPTPLQRRLGELGRVLIVVVLVAVVLIFALEVIQGQELFNAFMLSISLAVAAVPEGLPAVVTLALAIGLQRMVARNALIRRLPSVETLGSVTIICSDKTGTLTRNEMTVREIITAGAHYDLTGVGYDPEGRFLRRTRDDEPGSGEPVEPVDEPDLTEALVIAAWCNTAQVVPASEGPENGAPPSEPTAPEEVDGWKVIGDPTEGALVVAARKAGVEARDRQASVLHEIPFDSDRKAMSVVVRGDDGAPLMYTKGAPEILLDRCVAERRGGRDEPLTDERREQIRRENAGMADRALRVLALAERRLPDVGGDDYREEELTFVGMVGMIDPPREEVKEAVRRCRSAGIRPIMITGDHPATAFAIARELGIAAEGDRVVAGPELDRMSEDELSGQVESISVYARVSAEHKLKVVGAWKGRGQVVAMTGDGVNDAPAVKAADIGIAMGITGTDVTKQASDMVLTDDNFSSIVNAVEEGRGIFENIQKFVHYLLSCNAGEVLLMLVAAVLGWAPPLTAIQLLWINLVTDGLPALALGMEPPERDIMRRPPRPPREPVITRAGGLTILAHGGLIMLAGASAFLLVGREGSGAALAEARTAAFCTMAYAQLFFALACRSPIRTLPELGVFSNRYLLGAVAISGLLQLGTVTLPFASRIFGTVPLSGSSVAWIALFSLLPVTCIEVFKLLRQVLGLRAA